MILKSAQTAKIGKKFKNARELLGLSENEVSMETFMRTDFIQAIESGDYSIFPARIFALSYFKKYATFLGIQVIFFDIYDVKNLPPDEATKKPKSVIKELNSKLLIAVVSVVIAIILLLANLLATTNELSEPNKVIKTSDEELEKNFIAPSTADQATLTEALLFIDPLVDSMQGEDKSDFTQVDKEPNVILRETVNE
tara:strand:- start:38 stop:628 length:591 start_codon:yes stop_codon:yes gene_type:complete